MLLFVTESLTRLTGQFLFMPRSRSVRHAR